jgi:hypothetical protein
MALDIEGVVNNGVDAGEALGGAGRLEALQLPFSPTHRLVRDLRPAVLAQVLLMPRKAEPGKRAPTGPKPVGLENRRREALLPERP